MKKRHTIAPYLRKEWAANYRPGDRKRIYEVTQIHPRTLERALQDGIASDEVQHAITTFFKNRLQKEIEAAKELAHKRDEYELERRRWIEENDRDTSWPR